MVNLAVNECVTVEVKVVDVEVTNTVTNKYGKELTMQNIVIADNSGQCRIVLWENEIGKMELQKSYCLQNVAVCIFNDIKYLTLTESTIVVAIEDIGEIADPSLGVGQLQQEDEILEGEIIGVVSFEQYISCIGCKGKVTEETNMMGSAINVK